jgi:pyrroline-5-carboxylate reductase
MSIGFIGAGNMATAIIKGYIGKATTDVVVYDIDSEKVNHLAELGAKRANNIAELAERVQYLFLAVKPQNFPEVVAGLKGHVRTETVLVSIAAGITADYLKAALDFDVKVVLVMPNTPLLLGYGASALSKAEPTTDAEFDFVCNIFASSGVIAKIAPNQMNEVIPLNGSSPAFIYEYAKYFIEYGEQQGFSYETALNLFAQSLIGSAKMMTESGYSLDELIQMVSSKGGTTIAGLDALRKHDLQRTVLDCCDQCAKRAYELSK